MDTANSTSVPVAISQDAAKANFITAERDKLLPILHEAFKAQRIIGKQREGVSNSLIAIAAECGDRDIFTEATDRAEAMYKAQHKAKGIKKMPKVWTQAKSDVKAMFDRKVSLTEVNDAGETVPLSYSKAAKALNDARKKAQKSAEKAVEAETPEHLKQFRAVCELVLNTADAAYIREITVLIAEAQSEYRETHPEVQETEQDADIAQAVAA